MDAKQTPLIELLESVPHNARLVIDDADGMGSVFIPVGRLCHEAATALRERLAQPTTTAGYAKKIESLVAERDALKAELATPDIYPEEAYEMAMLAGFESDDAYVQRQELKVFYKIAIAKEREACARVCESIARDIYGMTNLREYGECAAAIRARGQG